MCYFKSRKYIAKETIAAPKHMPVPIRRTISTPRMFAQAGLLTIAKRFMNPKKVSTKKMRENLRLLFIGCLVLIVHWFEVNYQTFHQGFLSSSFNCLAIVSEGKFRCDFFQRVVKRQLVPIQESYFFFIAKFIRGPNPAITASVVRPDVAIFVAIHNHVIYQR